MIKILLHIKHTYPKLWQIVDRVNGFAFSLVYAQKVNRIVGDLIREFQHETYTIKQLQYDDLRRLEILLKRQPSGRLDYFKPHGFQFSDLKETWNNPAFFMFGVFHEDNLIGYFFLRCFVDRRCFVGRLVDWSYEGKGIGKFMNQIMYNTGWRAGFSVLSTISKNNKMVMKAHANNPSIVVLGELDNDYLFVKFIKND
jgi:hypothetical protein